MAPTKAEATVTCRECGTTVGGKTGKDIFSHMVTCLHVELNTLDNIRDIAEGQKNENGRRVIHLLDALQTGVTE